MTALESIRALMPRVDPIRYRTATAGPRLAMVRLDRLAPFASGNKIFKLQETIDYALRAGFPQLLSFGGAFSNHIHALALTARRAGLESIGIIRGEAQYANNPTLSDARAAGMQLEFVDRQTYRQRSRQGFLQHWQARYPQALIIPEGGADQRAVSGCRVIAELINRQMAQAPDFICCACGTGTTLAGLSLGLADGQQAVGYLVVKDASIRARINAMISAYGKTPSDARFRLFTAYDGGYARIDQPLLEFILDWLEQTGILLDPVYTAKMCRRLVEQIEHGEFSSDQSVAIIHSGGLQGWRGMRTRTEKLIGPSGWQRIQAALCAENPQFAVQ